MADTADVFKMKVADLKRELKLRGLIVTGNKTELQERLQSALLDGDLSLEDTAISEDLLDDDVLTDEEAESAVLESPIDEKSILSPESDINLKLGDEPKPKKVVILKRKSSLTTLTTPTTTNTSTISNVSPSEANAPTIEKFKKIEYNNTPNVNEINGKITASTDEDKKVKISQLSMKERLEMRAKKFGIKEGAVELTVGADTKSNIKSNDPKTIEALKKRAARFGCVVAPTIVEIEKAEKLQQRKERFGGGSTANGSTTSSVNSSVYAEKARLRLERFKTAAK